MIRVICGNNVKRVTKIVDSDTTPREILEEVGIDYASNTVHMDGATMNPGDMDRSFADLGITDTTYLLQVVKADNA